MFESVAKFGASTGLAFHSSPLCNLKQIRTSFFFPSAGWMEHSGAAAFWSRRGQLRNGTTCLVRGGCGGQSAAAKLRLGRR